MLLLDKLTPIIVLGKQQEVSVVETQHSGKLVINPINSNYVRLFTFLLVVKFAQKIVTSIAISILILCFQK